MDMIFEANVSATPPTPGTASGYPTDGDLTSGTPATIPGAYAFYMPIKEILNVIAAADITPDVHTLNQLLQAINILADAAATAAAAAAQAAAIADATTLANSAESAAIAEATTLANAAQTSAIADATTLANAAKTDALSAVLAWFTTGQTLGSSIVQPLPGGLILQVGTYTAATTDTAYTVHASGVLPNSAPGGIRLCELERQRRRVLVGVRHPWLALHGDSDERCQLEQRIERPPHLPLPREIA